MPHGGSRITPFYLNFAREVEVIPRKRFAGEGQTTTDPLVNEWVGKIAKFDELRHSIENQIKSCSDKRLAKANSNKIKQFEIKVGTEVYYSNKKLSNKAEGYASKLTHRYVGPATVKRIIGPMIVELVDKTDKIVEKYYVTDLKIPRRSLRKQ